jgi:hypothetical protein
VVAMTDHEMRKQVGAAIQRGDLDGALALLVGKPSGAGAAPRRQPFFELVEEEEDRGVVEIDEQVVTRLVAEKMVQMFSDVAGDVEAHVTTAINRARGRAD